MAFPIIPILAIGAIIGGAFTLTNYYSLSPREREQADRLALDKFRKVFDDLAAAEQKKILTELQRQKELSG